MSRSKHGPVAQLARESRKPLVSLRPEVDYPQQGERIGSRDYTVRVGVPGPVKGVEVAIDQGPWQSCRPAEGYWWFDWSGFDGGEHEVVARATDAAGARQLSESREFWVEP